MSVMFHHFVILKLTSHITWEYIPHIIGHNDVSYKYLHMRKGEIRSLPSEQYALQQLGIVTCIKNEHELMQEYTTRVPEGIFLKDGKIVSVEVKRIIGNRLPTFQNPDRRRYIVQRGQIIWPWKSTVEVALKKSFSQAILDYRVHTHYVVIVIPESLTEHHKSRIRKHVKQISTDTMIKTKVCIFEGPDQLFHRIH